VSGTLDPEEVRIEFNDATLADLTSRELAVLELVTNGMSNEEIAEQLYLSLNTVKTHIRTTYRKIGASTRAHAIIWGVRQGLLLDEPADEV
jgi:DNA-binding NarL/FixJ family response regulator